MKKLTIYKGVFYYDRKPATFTFVRRANAEEIKSAQKANKSKAENWAIFRCKQNGQLIGKEYRSADRDNS